MSELGPGDRILARVAVSWGVPIDEFAIFASGFLCAATLSLRDPDTFGAVAALIVADNARDIRAFDASECLLTMREAYERYSKGGNI